MILYKFTGAGNDFLIADGRKEDVSSLREKERISSLCAEYSTDGLMILGPGEEKPGTLVTNRDFKMEFFNPDGSSGMMCGNGGRCIVAFADYLGIKPGKEGVWDFDGPDGFHCGKIVSREGNLWQIRLAMGNVPLPRNLVGGIYVHTGAPHLVFFVPDVDAVDVETEGRKYRYDKTFEEIGGTNVDFVQVCDGYLKVRTYERGVERETLACGTGLTASAIAAYREVEDKKQWRLQCRRGDFLEVEFDRERCGFYFFRVFLTGPAEYLFATEV